MSARHIARSTELARTTSRTFAEGQHGIGRVDAEAAVDPEQRIAELREPPLRETSTAAP